MPARKKQSETELKLLYQAKFLVYKRDNKNAMNNIGHEWTNE